MSAEQNIHGLSRYIPGEVKRRVRQECFFGCVICGRLPYRYEHFDPPFARARAHDADGIALLCSAHEDDRTAGRLGIEAVRAARLSPINRTRDARYLANFALGTMSLNLGNTVRIFGCHAGVYVNGVPIIGLSAPSSQGDCWMLNGHLANVAGTAAMKVIDNEILVSRGLWDFTMEGKDLTAKTDSDTTVAKLVLNPDGNCVDVVQLDMSLGSGYRMAVRPEGLFLFRPSEDDPFVSLESLVIADGRLAIDYPEMGDPSDWARAG